MEFMSAYKHLEKLCGEVMDDERRLSAYIEEMEGNVRGARYVAGWESDLKKLKHYRWVRNRIVHDPEFSEEDLTGQEDVRWLEDFYDRIMDQTDPLALYRKATQPHSPSRPRNPAQMVSDASPRSAPMEPPLRGRPAGCAMFLLGVMAAVVLLLI